VTQVIGLDVSSSCTGVARTDGSTLSIKLKAGTDPYSRLHELGKALVRILDADKPELAVIEEPAAVRGRDAVRRLHEFVGFARYLCWVRGIRVVEVNPMKLKAWATGSGHASKDDMMAAAAARGATPANDDEADAFLLRASAVAYYENPERADAAVAAWLTGGKATRRKR
jgi:Holliday junction resolvasome RuvABC endonuclease subunit